MKLPESFLTAVATEIEEKVHRIIDYKTQVSDLQREIREIDIYLQNIVRFMRGFGYTATITPNNTVTIQFEDVTHND